MLCLRWRGGLAESTAPGLGQICSQVRAPTHLPQSPGPLTLPFTCNMGTPMLIPGDTGRITQEVCVPGIPLTLRRTMMANKASPPLLHLPSLCSDPREPFYSPSSSHWGLLAKRLFHTKLAPALVLHPQHCFSLRCFSPYLPTAHSPQVPGLCTRATLGQSFPDDTV